MTEAPSELLDLMRALVRGELAPAQFAPRYMALWKVVARDQDDAIAREPAIADAIAQLRERFGRGELSAAEYGVAMRAQYEALDGVAVVPGSDADRLLGHVFVEADALTDDDIEPPSADEEDTEPSPYVTGDELRDEVRRVLAVLDGAPDSTSA